MGRARRHGLGRFVISASARDLPRILIHIGTRWPTACPRQVLTNRRALENATDVRGFLKTNTGNLRIFDHIWMWFCCFLALIIPPNPNPITDYRKHSNNSERGEISVYGRRRIVCEYSHLSTKLQNCSRKGV